jgi:hypothetical protein
MAEADMSQIPAVMAMLVVLASAAGAQSVRFSQQPYTNAPDAYQRGMNAYYKTWSDLNQAQKRVAPYPGDWYRYEVARGQMDLLERTWKDGSYDNDQLNQAATDVQMVLDNNNLSAQDRSVLAQDLEQLHDLRIQYGY